MRDACGSPSSRKGQLTELFDLHDRLVRSLTSDPVVGAAGFDARRTTATRCLRELHQRPRRNQALGSRDVPGVSAPGFSGVRSGPTVALGGTHGSGRQRCSAGGRPGHSFELRALSTGALLCRDLDAQSGAVRRCVRDIWRTAPGPGRGRRSRIAYARSRRQQSRRDSDSGAAARRNPGRQFTI